jgi:hypothetical protein
LSRNDLTRFGLKPDAPIAAFVKRLRCSECGCASVVADLMVFEGQSHAQYLFAPDAPQGKEYFVEVNAFFDKHLEK